MHLYKDTYIQKDNRGMYVAKVEVMDTYYPYYLPIEADTEEEIKETITYYKENPLQIIINNTENGNYKGAGK